MPSADCDDNDTSSIFSYDGEGDPDRISLRHLADAVEQFFNTSCRLTKLEEGGFHKVYEIFGTDGMSKNAVVRVASPDERLEWAKANPGIGMPSRND